MCDARVVAELELGGDAQAKGATNPSSKMAGNSSQPLKCGRTLRIGAEHADEDLRVAKVARDLDGRDRHKPENARVFDVVGEEGGNLLSHRGSDAVGAMMIRRHESDRC